MSGAQAPGRHGSARPRPGYGRRPPPRSSSGRLGLAVMGGLLLAVVVGCSESSGSTGEGVAARSDTSVTASPFPPDRGTSAASTATPAAAGGATETASAAPDGVTSGGGSSGASGAAGSAGAGGAAGSGGSAGSGGAGSAGAGAGAAPAAPGASPAPGAAGGGGGAAAATMVPTPQPSAVFLGEACAPGRNKAPATAVNGLVLYCVPDDGAGSSAGGAGTSAGGAGSSAGGRWSTEPPTSSVQPPPEEGGSCQQADVGRVLRDSAGRPVSCLRDPNGLLSWSDVS
ncbi:MULTISPECIES: hypothetical protein [Frankia]|nr:MULTISPECIES: hypothetical protein [Frankia]